jgi:hypothetical protein
MGFWDTGNDTSVHDAKLWLGNQEEGFPRSVDVLISQPGILPLKTNSN